MITDTKIYDFCLYWAMTFPVGTKKLAKKYKIRFSELNLSFEEFKKIARKNCWYVSSMELLKDIV
jgi:hypothetical protein